jgi:hypothetical protein
MSTKPSRPDLKLTVSNAKKLHKGLVQAATASTICALELGEMLYKAQHCTVSIKGKHQKVFAYYGFDSFKAYVETATGLNAKYASRTVRIWAVFGKLYPNRWSPAKYPKVSRSKLRLLVRLHTRKVLNEDNIDEWLSLANDINHNELDIAINEAVGNPLKKGSARFLVPVTPANKAWMDSVLDYAVAVLGCDSREEALLNILSQYRESLDSQEAAA